MNFGACSATLRIDDLNAAIYAPHSGGDGTAYPKIPLALPEI
jgi:hypothetical protein